MPVSNKEKYRNLCEEKNIPLFMQAWWMDVVCANKEWDVLLIEHNGEIRGSLVYLIINKFGFKLIIQPQLTQYNGVWLNYPDGIEGYKRYSFEKKIMTDLIDQLKKLNIDYFEQNFHFTATNWQPFYWKGFKQTTRYTFLIPDISDEKNIFSSFHHSKQRHIKKAIEKLHINFELAPSSFYDLYTQELRNKGKSNYYSKDFFKKVCSIAIERNQGAIITLYDEAEQIHASLFAVWDSNSAYNLVYYINPEFKSSGASSLIVFEMICFLSGKTKAFDFEGSMIESVAESYQMFGTQQLSYFHIQKNYSKTLALLLGIQNKIKKR